MDSTHFTDGKTDKQTGQVPGLEGSTARVWTLPSLTLSLEPFFFMMWDSAAPGWTWGIRVAPEGWACLNRALSRSRSSPGLGPNPNPRNAKVLLQAVS